MSKTTNKIQITGIVCPNCKKSELKSKGILRIRGYKVYDSGQWWSHCLDCDIWFGEDGTIKWLSSEV